eukprot:331311-Amphidinium_carterae.1
MLLGRMKSSTPGAVDTGEAPVVANLYVQTSMIRRHPIIAENVRSFKELLTLGMVMDYMSKGELGRAADMVAQRFAAVELATIQKSWDQARWIELIPPGSQ